MADLVTEGSLARMLRWRPGEDPDRGFLHVEDEGPWTFAQLASASVELTDRLAAVRSGDKVVVRVGNDERFLPAATAVWCREAAVVPMHPSVPAEEVGRVVAALDAAAVICAPDDPVVRALPVPTVTMPRFAAADTPRTG